MVGAFVSRIKVSEISSFKTVDYGLLCPFCDEVWPKIPSAMLLRLKAAVMKCAYPSPRLSNPGGMLLRAVRTRAGLVTRIATDVRSGVGLVGRE